MFSLALGYSFWKVFIHALSFIMTPKEGALVMPTSRGISSQSPFPTDSSAELESFLRFEKTDFLLSAHFFSVSIWFPRTFSKLLFYLFTDKLIGYYPQKCSFFIFILFVLNFAIFLPSMIRSLITAILKLLEIMYFSRKVTFLSLSLPQSWMLVTLFCSNPFVSFYLITWCGRQKYITPTQRCPSASIYKCVS